MQKTIYLFILFITITDILLAQEVNVISKTKLIFENKKQYYFPVLSNSGNKLALTQSNYKGIDFFDIETSETKQLTDDKGAGFRPVFTDDDKIIYYRSHEFNNGLKYSKINAVNIETGETKEIETKTRNLSTPQLINGELVYVNKRFVKRSPIAENSVTDSTSTFVYIEKQKIALWMNGKKQTITPNGNGNYIWASLSPDKTRLVYTFAGKGTFVYNISNQTITKLGNLNYPSWFNNLYIIGMNDKDDTHKILTSDIIIISADGKYKKNMTATNDQIEMYPYSSANKIVYHTTTGDIYLMEISIQ